MNRKSYILNILWVVLMLVACTADRPYAVTPEPQPSGQAGRGTRFAIYGTTFPRNATIGLYFCEHEDVAGNDYAAAWSTLSFSEHNIGYNNIEVRKEEDADAWSFRNNVVETWSSALYITANDNHTTADVFAYAPYVRDAVSPAEIPFVANRNNDLMYAEENATGVNKDMNEQGSGELTLHFRHTLSRISVVLRTKYTTPVQSDHQLRYITIRKAGGMTTPLYVSGKFNAITGTYSNLAEGDSLTADFGSESFFSGTAGRDFGVMIYPTEYQADGDLEIVINVNGFRKVFGIAKEDVKHSDGITYGFLGGKSYIFNFTVDNYIHFDGAEVLDTWESDQINVTI